MINEKEQRFINNAQNLPKAKADEIKGIVEAVKSDLNKGLKAEEQTSEIAVKSATPTAQMQPVAKATASNRPLTTILPQSNDEPVKPVQKDNMVTAIDKVNQFVESTGFKIKVADNGHNHPTGNIPSNTSRGSIGQSPHQ